ncbi:hypothetical protein [Methylobacterium longum]|jgi:hypothetical protein|uniref:Secreted protein n=1 Tax=Methylobacterium longum TaxID=767694 RepID=A0ABT8AZ45_9HYPH|nr:hypothetical protein [Methylobacterium longum]MDN3574715.1 hypothetical protein [Methylobacterium longum]
MRRSVADPFYPAARRIGHRSIMRMPVFSLSATLVLMPPPVVSGPMAAPVDPRVLQSAWHRCLREAYAHQPAGQSRAGNERNALDECKPREDALVAALMSGHRPDDARSGTLWARTWAAFVEPLTAWFGALRR